MIDPREINTPGALRNGVKTKPETPGAIRNEGLLIGATRDAGYAKVAEAIQLDKSWITRFFSGEGRVTLPELLHWLDSIGLQIVEPSAEADAERQLLQALLRKTSASLAREAGEVSGDTVEVGAVEYRALLHFAQSGIKGLEAKAAGAR